MEEFKKIEIDPDLLDLIPSFIKNTNVDWEDLHKAYLEQNFVQVRKVCHKILGSARSYGFVELDEITYKVQKSAKENNSEKLIEDIKLLKRYIVHINQLEFE